MQEQEVVWNLSSGPSFCPSSSPRGPPEKQGVTEPKPSPWLDDLRASATGTLGGWYPRKSKNPSKPHWEKKMGLKRACGDKVVSTSSPRRKSVAGGMQGVDQRPRYTPRRVPPPSPCLPALSPPRTPTIAAAQENMVIKQTFALIFTGRGNLAQAVCKLSEFFTRFYHVFPKWSPQAASWGQSSYITI